MLENMVAFYGSGAIFTLVLIAVDGTIDQLISESIGSGIEMAIFPLLYVWYWPVYLGNRLWKVVAPVLCAIYSYFEKAQQATVMFGPKDYSKPHCPICSEDFSTHSEILRCKVCNVFIHPECFEWNGNRCGIYGCVRGGG